MIDALNTVLLVVGFATLVGLVVFSAFRILNLGSHEEPIPLSPDAWRVRRGNRYYYTDKAEPFPAQEAEPLYLGKKR
jgi:hypothetical protein